jgi:hypothetical protein
MPFPASTWFITLLLGLLVLTPAHAGMTPWELKQFEDIKAGAEKGEAISQGFFGIYYFVGNGVPKDQVQAVFWFRKAAEQGYVGSQNMLGFCYANGHGVAKDQAQAVSWYRKAAEQGDTIAQTSLGRMYNVGEGVTKDVVEAYAYFNLAGITEEGARRSLTRLEKMISADQIAAGKKRTLELRKEIEAKIAAKAPSKKR